MAAASSYVHASRLYVKYWRENFFSDEKHRQPSWLSLGGFVQHERVAGGVGEVGASLVRAVFDLADGCAAGA